MDSFVGQMNQAAQPLKRLAKCRLCPTTLKREDGDNLERGLCALCKNDPEADALAPLGGTLQGLDRAPSVAGASPFGQLLELGGASGGQQRAIAANAPSTEGPSPFAEADLSMIKKVGRFMQPETLLDILNERLIADQGRRVPRHTMEQLKQALQQAHGEALASSGARDWLSLRRLLAQARQSGVLQAINEQVIDDFAVVFQLNPKQVVQLKEILLAQDGV